MKNRKHSSFLSQIRDSSSFLRLGLLLVFD